MNKVKGFVVKHQEIIGDILLFVATVAISTAASEFAIRRAMKDSLIEVRLPENFRMAKFID